MQLLKWMEGWVLIMLHIIKMAILKILYTSVNFWILHYGCAPSPRMLTLHPGGVSLGVRWVSCGRGGGLQHLQPPSHLFFQRGVRLSPLNLSQPSQGSPFYKPPPHH